MIGLRMAIASASCGVIPQPMMWNRWSRWDERVPCLDTVSK